MVSHRRIAEWQQGLLNKVDKFLTEPVDLDHHQGTMASNHLQPTLQSFDLAALDVDQEKIRRPMVRTESVQSDRVHLNGFSVLICPDRIVHAERTEYTETNLAVYVGDGSFNDMNVLI